MNRDFYDEDLVKPREEIKRIKVGPADDALAGPAAEASAPAAPNRPVSDLNMTLMARHRQRVDHEASRAMEEIERLRRQQEDLEREKRELEDARRKQSDYEQGKRALLDGLNQSLVTIERNEIKTQQMAEMLSSIRRRFRDMLQEISSLDEESWPEDQVREELGKALVRVDDARIEYNKAMARIEAVLKPSAEESGTPILFDAPSTRNSEEKTFTDWLKIGVAVTLPLLILLGLLFLVLIGKSI
ncbi:MAG: hypothetical protein U1E27_10785 [Kiritimatiellia bacterium]|nr:hypothetical protein [Kiritimatiellia bacterium]